VHAGRPTIPMEKSRELQCKLYLEAKRSRNRRFHALYDRIFRPDILRQAWGKKSAETVAAPGKMASPSRTWKRRV